MSWWYSATCFVFQLTRSVGSVTHLSGCFFRTKNISTHTLRGAREKKKSERVCRQLRFQLTRTLGSLTPSISEYKTTCKISTHTLRGERDGEHKNNIIEAAFQLTRSVGSVTLHIVYVKSHHHNRADILLKITLKIDIFYIICIIFSANLHIKPISLHVRSQNQTALRVICFLCTYMLHSPLPIITQIIESKAILFFINNFHKSIF